MELVPDAEGALAGAALELAPCGVVSGVVAAGFLVVTDPVALT